MTTVYLAPTRTAGLNNLKLVIFGMAQTAAGNGGTYQLPDRVFDFTPIAGSIGDGYLPTGDVFDMTALRAHFDCPAITGAEPARLGNAEYLKAAQDEISRDVGEAGIAHNSTAKAFAAFLPAKSLQNEIDRIFTALPFETCALQLRIERDWQEYAARKGWIDGGTVSGCEVVLNHRRIFDKIATTNGIPRNIFVCCDEDDLTISKEEIRKDAETRGLNLIFKSSFKTPVVSRLQKSVIDFGVCLKLKTYVGTPRSTFSNILCIVKAAEELRNPDHYVFDAVSENVLRRYDCGRAINAAHSTTFDYLG